jgi:hypothetical protein
MKKLDEIILVIAILGNLYISIDYVISDRIMMGIYFILLSIVCSIVLSLVEMRKRDRR